MTARMRRVGVGGSPVPWLAMAAAVLVVVALAWLTTEEQLAAQSGRDVQSFDASPTTVAPSDDDPPTPFSGQAAVDALVVDPGAGFTRAPDGSGGIGPRTEESLVAGAVARGDSGEDMRAGLREAEFRGGVTKAWRSGAGNYVLVIILDEFGTEAGARAWAAGVGQGFEHEQSSAPIGLNGYRYDRTRDGTQIHYASYVIQRGRYVAAVSVSTDGTLDTAVAEAHVRAQIDRLEQAAR